MSKFGAFSGTKFGGFASSKFGARGTGIKIHEREFSETMAWVISGKIEHFRSVNGAPDAMPVDSKDISGIAVNFQFYKMAFAAFGISTHEYSTARISGYNGSIDPNNDTLSPGKHPGFTLWDPFSLSPATNFNIVANAAWAAIDNPVGGGVGMGVDASTVIFEALGRILNLDGSVTSAPSGFVTHSAELDSGNGPISQFDTDRICCYYPNPGLSSFFSGDTGAPDFWPIRSIIELRLKYELTG